jgi:hypothetical protein
MPTVEYIKNVTAATKLNNATGTFTKLMTGMPPANPDEAIIRSINWNGDAADNRLYLVWCNLTNDYIGSFCGASLTPQSLGITIRLNSPIPNVLEFKLYTPLVGEEVMMPNDVTGEIAIHIDLIKYTRTPPHA